MTGKRKPPLTPPRHSDPPTGGEESQPRSFCLCPQNDGERAVILREVLFSLPLLVILTRQPAEKNLFHPPVILRVLPKNPVLFTFFGILQLLLLFNFIIYWSKLNLMPNFINFFLDLIFPPACLVCQKQGAFICSDCQKDLLPLERQICPYCAKPLSLIHI